MPIRRFGGNVTMPPTSYIFLLSPGGQCMYICMHMDICVSMPVSTFILSSHLCIPIPLKVNLKPERVQEKVSLLVNDIEPI